MVGLTMSGVSLDALFHQTARDLRDGWRGLRRQPAMTAVAILSLSLGIGANTAIVSVVDTLLVRSLPIRDPGSLVVVERIFSRGTVDFVTYPAFERLRDAHVFGAVSASTVVERSGIEVPTPAGPTSATLVVGLVSGTYFQTLGVGARLGRTLTPDDDARARPVAVLSVAGWQHAFGAAPDVVGRTFVLNATTWSVVGVADPPFLGETLGQTTDLWVPVSLEAQVMPERPGLLQNPGSNWIRVLGRLSPQTSLAQAEAAATAAVATLPPTASQFGASRLSLGAAGRGFTNQRDLLGKPLAVLSVVVGLILLMACTNVATLLLARATSRRKEVALRLALGAGRGRLIRQLLAESLVLATAAGAAGFAVAIAMTRALTALAASGRSAFGVRIAPDARMLALTALISLATGLLFGLWPAMRATRLSLVAALTGSSEVETGVTGFQMSRGRLLVTLQVAMSVALVMVGILFGRTLANLESAKIGFDRDHVWLYWMMPSQAGLQGAALAPLFTAAAEQVAGIPGVVSVSPSSDGVLSGFVGLRAVTAEGHVPSPDEDVNAQWNIVGARFFDTVGMHLLAGRDLTSYDTATAPPVAVVNETMARRFFPGLDPIGKRFAFGTTQTRLLEVVGVVGDARYFSAREAATPMVFLPYLQNAPSLFRMCVVVRLASDAPSLVARVRDVLTKVDARVPVRLVNTTAGQLDLTLAEERLMAWLAGCCGGLALLLACVGLYGVMAFVVARQTREIGIRVALGETRGAIMRRVLGESLQVVAVGALLGVPAAMVGSRWVATLLFGVAPTDPLTTFAAVMSLTLVALLAAVIPARRAATVDPLVALRVE
jgi:predicted permease